jgi:hypothetical protein
MRTNKRDKKKQPHAIVCQHLLVGFLSLSSSTDDARDACLALALGADNTDSVIADIVGDLADSCATLDIIFQCSNTEWTENSK